MITPCFAYRFYSHSVTKSPTFVCPVPPVPPPKAEASALDHNVCLKSIESTAIAGNHRGHKAFNGDLLQTDHHSNQGGTDAIVSSAKLVVLLCRHRVQRGPTESGAD